MSLNRSLGGLEIQFGSSVGVGSCKVGWNNWVDALLVGVEKF